MDADSPPAPEKKTMNHESFHRFSKLLLTSIIIFLLLLKILLSVAMITLFKNHSQLLDEKAITKELNYTDLECTKQHSSPQNKVWSCCPKDWKPFSSHCYFPTIDTASWRESEEKCSSMGAHLMVIHSQEEQDFITKILDPKAAYYIGLLDPGHRQWRWVDQTPYNESATLWHSEEPSGKKGFCVVLNYHPNVKGWGLSDISYDGYYRSVCEMMQLSYESNILYGHMTWKAPLRTRSLQSLRALASPHLADVSQGSHDDCRLHDPATEY
ncbi:C-type lectin domain family 4 member A-like [Peromyscus maniculatus bairdii]|uniref:C-type lectin domain family 4 member A-like n=1 Tax=Peromyscus maniculatus bairdii TaxID=230844 RepID=UPI003FD23AA8